MALNKVMLIGNVGNDPEVRYLESNPQNPAANAKVASFRLATTERYRDRSGELRENTEWHSIVVWRNNADVVEKFVHKGSQIYIEGKLRTRQWTDQTGNKRYTTEVVADAIQLLGKRADDNGGAPYAPAQGGSAPAAGPVGQPYAPSSAPSSAPAAGPVGGSVGGPVGGPMGGPVGGPAPVAGPAQSYQGPMPAAEPSDDLPF